jgi:arsenate reductase (glutaredoxin)
MRQIFTNFELLLYAQMELFSSYPTKFMSIKVYGIPNCGTCKKALQWLDDAGATYEFINTKEQPPALAEISEWVKTLGSKPLRNTSGLSYRALGEDKQAWTEEQWAAAFAKDAMLIKRPLFLKNGVAVITGMRGKDADMRSKLGL